jgi:hypothetical protein
VKAILNLEDVKLYMTGLPALFKYIITLAQAVMFRKASSPIFVTSSLGVNMSQRVISLIGNNDTKNKMMIMISILTTCLLERRVFIEDLSDIDKEIIVSEVSLLIICEYIQIRTRKGNAKKIITMTKV